MDQLAQSPILIQGQINGLDLAGCGDLIRWELHSEVWAPQRLQLHFDQVPAAADAALHSGSPLHISGEHNLQFHGHISDCQWRQDAGGRCQVTLTALDGLKALSDAQSLRRFSNLSTRQIITEICAQHGLRCIGDAGPQWRDVYQTHQSDLDFIIDLAQRSNLGYQLQQQTLELFPLRGRPAAPIHIDARRCQQASLQQQSLGLAQEIQAQAWDFGEHQLLRGTSPRSNDGIGQRFLSGLVADNEQQMQALSSSIQQQRHTQHQHIQLRAHGFPALRVGDQFTVSGLRGLDQAAANTAACCLKLQISNDAQLGLSHLLSSAMPTMHPPKRESILCSAEVCAVADPKKRGRIRVRFLHYNNLDSHWLPVISAGAGPDRGFFALPDIGDQVAVLVANSDLAQALVLGGVMGQAAFENAGIVGNALKQYHIRAPGGHQISLDASGAELLVQHAKGSALRMRNSGVDLTVNGNLNISAAGKAITFTASKIDFKRG